MKSNLAENIPLKTNARKIDDGQLIVWVQEKPSAICLDQNIDSIETPNKNMGEPANDANREPKVHTQTDGHDAGSRSPTGL
jgi:hypothetical protein